MNKATITVLSAAVLVGGCVAPPGAPSPSGTSTPSRATAAATLPAAAFSPETLQGPIVLRSSNMNLVVQDPVATMEELERLVEEAGGFVSSASSWSSGDGGYSSLSARVPLHSLTGIRQAARGLALQVQSDSSYSQDVTSEYARLVERLRQLKQAEREIRAILAVANDPERVSSFQLVFDLLRQETDNITSQVTSYNDQATLATFDVSLTSMPATPYYFVPTPTPTAYFPWGAATATPSAVY